MGAMKKIYPVIFLLLGLYACRKTNTAQPQGNTFFKTYDTHLSNWNYSKSFIYATGGITTDNEGNLYTWYFDTCLSHAYTANILGALNTVAVLKTDKHGNMIWNRRLFAFTPAWIPRTYGLFSNDDFACIGDQLYLAGQDTNGHFTILKFNADGNYLGEIPLNGLAPAGAAIRGFYSMWPTKEGNLLLNFTCRQPSLPETTAPYVVMVSASGAPIWQTSAFPFSVSDTLSDSSMLSSVVENNDGSFTFAGLGYNDNFGPFSYVQTNIINCYHLDKNGRLLFARSLYEGSGLVATGQQIQLYKCNGLVFFPKIFVGASGYIVGATQLYDQTTDYDLKFFHSDTAFNVLDSSEIREGSSVIELSAIMQKQNGNLIFTTWEDKPPSVTYLCHFYEMSPQYTIITKKQIGLNNLATTVSGITLNDGDHIAITGLIQPLGVDTGKLFILKMDNNELY